MEQRRREVNATVGTPFRNIHAIMHPSASGGTVVQLPPKAPDKVTMDRGGRPVSQAPQIASANDLLDGVNQAAKKEDTVQLTDFFDSVVISSPSTGAAAHHDSNPFSTFAQVPATFSSGATPTIVQLPIKPPTSAHAQVHHQGPVTPFVGSPQGASYPHQQGHASQMVNRNTIGHPGPVPHGVSSNAPPQYQQPSTYQQSPPTQNVIPAFHPHSNQSPTMTGPPHPTTQPPLQRPPSSNLSQFDPFAKR